MSERRVAAVVFMATVALGLLAAVVYLIISAPEHRVVEIRVRSGESSLRAGLPYLRGTTARGAGSDPVQVWG